MSIKFLVRGKRNFLEVKLEENGGVLELKPTNREVDPTTLVHFGTDLVDWRDGYHLGLDKKYIQEMKRKGVDYLFISRQLQEIEFAQSGRILVEVTAYIKR